MIEIYIAGVPRYEPEHVARIFFTEAHVATRYPAHGADAVVVRITRTRILCALRQHGACTLRIQRRTQQAQTQKELEYAVCLLLYGLLKEQTGTQPPWGMLTGVRPVRIVHDMRARGETESAIARWFSQDYDVSEEKLRLALCVADAQQPFVTQRPPRNYSLYISIPFCPSRCSYCSFVSRETASSAHLLEPYVTALCTELADIAETARRNRLVLQTIYIGGGTPTALSAPQLARLMQTVREQFDVHAVQEYTVEAGRPDCTTREKLDIIKAYGATRISINPQSLSDEVLRAIGRKHSAQDVLACFAEARAAGHANINMDLIAGLPLDTPQGFRDSLQGVLALAPENITVHTLTLKRASNLVIEGSGARDADVTQMLADARAALAQAYTPYYLYRQKGTLGNLENTGYTRPGFTGLYNIYIMEEVHTILSAGAGGSTKLVAPQGGQIQRIFNHKYPTEYLERFDVVRERKKGVDTFYGQFVDMDTQEAR